MHGVKSVVCFVRLDEKVNWRLAGIADARLVAGGWRTAVDTLPEVAGVTKRYLQRDCFAGKLS